MKNLTVLERRTSSNPIKRFDSLKHPEVYVAENIEDYLSTPMKQPFYQQMSKHIINNIPSEHLVVIPNLSIQAYNYEHDISFADHTDKLSFVVNRYFFPEGHIENTLFDTRRFEKYCIIFTKEFSSDTVQLQGAAFQSEVDSLLHVVENPFPKGLARYVLGQNHLRLIRCNKEAI